MEIKDIENPYFLKKMNDKELNSLAENIRKFIIENVSKTGGHLSSNLGVVELTIALHKVFSCPKDKIIFDVSHQSYTHKILTGRANKFNTLRQINGISGFQSIFESEYDSYSAGHSSTSLSAALGFAISRDINKQKYDVVAVIGDASIENGLAFEALNQIATLKKKVIIVLNDNSMSVSKNVGAFHVHLDKVRSAKSYDETKTKTKAMLNKIPLIGNKLTYLIHKIKSSIKKLYFKTGFIYEELGISYFGPIDGHNINDLSKYLTIAKNTKKPVILHVITKKGKGYKYAEEDTFGNWHGVGPFDIDTGKSLTSNDNKVSWSQVICECLIRLYNKNLVVITPAMENGSKLLKFKESHPKNFIDTGIAEEHALVLANALAVDGKIPFVSIYSSFLQRGYDEVVHDIARMNSHVIIGIDRAGIVGEDGETHQGVFDITFLLPIPNIVISAPKDSIEAANILSLAINTNSPFAIRYSRNKIEYCEEKIENIKVGSWEKLTEGKDATLITYGDFVSDSYEIINMLKKDNINVELVNARFLKPIDTEYFDIILKKNKPIFVYEESMEIGSLGSYLKTKTDKEINIFAIKDSFITHGKREIILKELELDKISIYNKIKKRVNIC